jgi:phospholipid transport system transporter-binding protein
MRLPAIATLAQTTTLLGELGAGQELIDASALTEFDTSVVAFLLEARRRAEARGTACVIRGAPQKLVQLARLYGVEELLSLEAT